MSVSAFYLVFIIGEWTRAVAARNGCPDPSTDADGNYWCTSTVARSITTPVTLIHTSTSTDVSTVPLTTPSLSGTKLIVPSLITESFPPSTQSTTANAADYRNRPHSLAGGAKAGIVIGAIALACLFCGATWFLWRRIPLPKHTGGPKGPLVEKTGSNYGADPRSELDGIDTAYHPPELASNYKGQSYQSYQSSTLQDDCQVNSRASVSRPADELFIPMQEPQAAPKSQVYITNADVPREEEPRIKPGLPLQSNPGHPQVLNIGRQSSEVSVRPSSGLAQDEHHSYASTREMPQVSVMSGLIEEERRLDEQIAEAKMLTDLYQPKEECQSQPQGTLEPGAPSKD